MGGFRMGFSKESLKGIEPVPPGTYRVLFIKFNPKFSEKKDSINLNMQVKVLNRPDLGENRFIYANLNTQIPSFIQDAVHSFGLEMEDQLGEHGDPQIPGIFDADKAKFKEDDPTTYVYDGPLKGKTAEWEVSLRDYKGREQQDIIRFICAVPQCAERFARNVKHATDMRKKT